jgi:hypothetical protein
MSAIIEHGSRRMVAAPWRICRAVYPDREAVWPIDGRDIAAVLADCRRLIAAERARAAHWTFDFNRLVALKQAEQALIHLLSRAAGTRQAAPEHRES